MELTMRQLSMALPSLKKLSEMELPVKLAFRISRLLNPFQTEVQHFIDIRNKLLKKHGSPVDESEREYSVPPENVDDFQADLDKLQSETVDILFAPISINELEGANMTPQDLMALDFLITE